MKKEPTLDCTIKGIPVEFPQSFWRAVWEDVADKIFKITEKENEMDKPPERIWLQIEDYDPGDEFDPSGATWSEDSLNDSDVEYVKAELFAKEHQAFLDSEIARLQAEIKLEQIVNLVRGFGYALEDEDV